MDLSNLVAVSGVSGIQKMAVNRKNGLILENIDTQKRSFYSSRKFQFTPLESISIYTLEGTEELATVLRSMRDKVETTPPVAPKSDNDTLRAYFGEILPEFDRDRVFVSDIKRLIKWFNFLQERNLLEDIEEEADDVEVNEIQGVSEEE